MTTTENNTTSAPTATIGLREYLSNPLHLARSLEMSASYLEACADKHDAKGSAARHYRRSINTCLRFAQELREMKLGAVSLVCYRNVILSLDESQLEAMSGIVIDYQARLGGQFTPSSAHRYLNDLTTMAFALEAIDEPSCLLGVGGGLVPRHRMREAA